MTTMDKAVTRRTVRPYRISISGAYQSESGRQIVVTLRDDMIVMREAGRRLSYRADVADIYAWMVRGGRVADGKKVAND